MKIKLLLLFAFFTFSAQSQLDKNLSNAPIVNFEEVDFQPEYPGGQIELEKFVVSNFELPEVENSGSIIVSFIIDSDGTMNDFKVVKDLGNDSGKAVINALKKAKRWKPGEHKGLPAKVRYNITIKVTG